MFWRLKYWLPENLLLKAKIYAASTTGSLKLLMLVSDFMVNPMLKNTQRYFCGMHRMSQQGCEEEKKHGFYASCRG